jgi:hypothetical protein
MASRPASMRLAMAGLDALGDGDFAFAAEQFDGAHFAQIHAHRIVGTVGVFARVGDGRLGFVALGDGFGRGGVVLGGFALFFGVDDIDAHAVEFGHHVFDLLG